MAERAGLDPGAVSAASAELRRGLVVLDGLVDGLLRSVRAAADPFPAGLGAGDRVIAPWSLPIAVVASRRLEEAWMNAVALIRELGEQVARQRAASAADDASYTRGFVSVGCAAALYRLSRLDPALLERLDPSTVAAFFRALTPAQGAALAVAQPSAVGALEGAPYSVRDAANRESLHRLLDDPSIPVGDPRRLAAEQTVQALADAAARRLGAVQLVTLALPADGRKTDMRAAISIGDLDRAADVGVMVPGMNSNVEDSMRNLVWNAGNMQENLGSPGFNGNAVPTAVIAWMAYAAPSGNPFDGDRFVGSDESARQGGIALGHLLRGIETSSPDARVTVLAHSYGTRVATDALTTGGRADALVMYGSPGVSEGIANADEILGVPGGNVYSTKSAGDLLWSTGNVLSDAIRAGLTGQWGNLGVDVLGEEMSNVDGTMNADPNDESFGAKVFDTYDTSGHGLGEEGGTYAGYWGIAGTDSLDNGALIVLGREPVTR